MKRKAMEDESVTWLAGDGRAMRLSEFEDDHLRNTIAYLHRKKKEWDDVKKVVRAKSTHALGGLRVRERPVEEWLNLLCGELILREKAEAAGKLTLRKILAFKIF